MGCGLTSSLKQRLLQADCGLSAFREQTERTDVQVQLGGLSEGDRLQTLGFIGYNSK